MIQTINERFVYTSTDFDLEEMLEDPDFLKTQTKKGNGHRDKRRVDVYIKQVLAGNRPVYIEVNLNYGADMPKKDVRDMHKAIHNHFNRVAARYEI